MENRMKDSLRAAFRSLVVILLAAVLASPALAANEKEKKKVVFNFVDVELPIIAKFVSEVTGKNFIFDESFKGQVTIIAPSKMDADDSFRLFTSVLQLKGFTVVSTGFNAYKIIRSAGAKQEGVALGHEGGPVNESYIARLLQLKYISSEEAVNFLRPVVSKDGHISSFGASNTLFLIDSGANIDKIVSILQIIDQPTTTEAPEIVFLRYAGADEVAKMVNEGNQTPGAQAGRAAGSPVTGRVVADTRLNAVIIFGPREVRESLKRLVAILDVPAEESQGRINVYHMVNADATEVAKVLQGVIKGIEEAKAGTAAAAAPSGRREIIVTPDKASNSLVVIASPGEYRNISAIIKKLDKRKRQVYIEAMIVEASINNLAELGSKWRYIAERNGQPVVIGGVGVMDQSSMTNIVTGLAGFTLGGMGNFMNIPITTIGPDGTATTQNLTVPGFSALFSLQEFKGIINVMSTPQILTSDNQEAEIMVGENVPFIARKEADPARSTSVFNTIDRQDVGVKLKLTPQIAEGEYVRVDLYQEISALKQENTVVTLSVGPTTIKRSTKTSVVVKDNQTVVIGGLMQEKFEEDVTKVPLLGDIPILGWLFKWKNETKQKTNLFIFLTPHIIRGGDDFDILTRNKSIEFSEAQNRFIPGQLLVGFRPGVDRERIEKIMAETESSVVTYLDKLDTYVVATPKGLDIEDAIERFSKVKEVRFAEPNYPYTLGGKKNRLITEFSGAPPADKPSANEVN